MQASIRQTSFGLALGAGTLLFSGLAQASNVLEVPDNGSEQMQRGGAWVARASDPLAVFFNPAGLAGQDTRLLLNANINIQHTCFTRVRSQDDTTNEPASSYDPTTREYPKVCNDAAPFPNPQLAFAFRLTDRIGLGFAILGPSASGKSTWPEFVNGSQPAPQRYLLLKADALQLTPTLGAGFEVIDGLRLGASFQWGITQFHLSNASIGLNGDNLSPVSNDVKALVQVKDMFTPGFTLGAIYSPIEQLDIAGWYKWSAPIDAKGDLIADANYFTPKVAAGDTSGTKGTDTSGSDCGSGATGSSAAGCGGQRAEVKATIPMEAKLGFRYHKPRVGNTRTSHKRDPLAQDVFDIELDLTWANNSALDAFKIRFPGDDKGNGIVPINGTGGGTLPPNADQIKGFKDVFGVRLGGDYNVIPDTLAIRAGVFYESNGQDNRYQNIDFAGAARFGLAGGAAYRLRLGKEEKKNALEFTLGYGHVFYGIQDNKNPNAPGFAGLAGVPCNPTSNFTSGAATCNDGKTKFRTNWPVNLGTITNAVNMINVGFAYRF